MPITKGIGKVVKEFRDFAMRGNVIDLSVGIVVGSAFNKIITSFVDDVLMPPIGLILGKVDFSNLFINLSPTHYESLADAEKVGAATLNYGIFVNNIINFLIVAMAVFFLVKQINRLRRHEEGTSKREATDKNCPFCYSKIPIRAVRCPACTSQLPAETEDAKTL